MIVHKNDETKKIVNKFYVEFNSCKKFNSMYRKNTEKNYDYNKENFSELLKEIYKILSNYNEDFNEYTFINGVLYKKLECKEKSVQSKTDISRFKYSYLIDGYLKNEGNGFIERIKNFKYIYIYDFKSQWNIENIERFNFEEDNINHINIKNIDVYNSYLKVLKKGNDETVSENNIENSLDVFKQLITLKIIKNIYNIYNKKEVEISSTLGYSYFLLTKITDEYILESKIQHLYTKLDSKKINKAKEVYNDYSKILKIQS